MVHYCVIEGGDNEFVFRHPVFDRLIPAETVGQNVMFLEIEVRFPFTQPRLKLCVRFGLIF